MMRTFVTAAALALAAWSAQAQGLDRLYVVDCGWAHAPDQARWSPGVNVGVPIDISDNCYLLHHSTGGYLLWDTGITDKVADMPEGMTSGATGMTWHRTKTLLAALASMQRIADIMAEKRAQLWINHDKPSSDARCHEPQDDE